MKVVCAQIWELFRQSSFRLCLWVSVLCSPVSKPCYGILCLLNLFLRLDSSIEDWAVSTLAKNLLMQWSLTTLTLHPQVAIFLLIELKLLLTLDVNVLHPDLTVFTHDLLSAWKQAFTPKTGLLDFSELKQTHVRVTHCRLEDIPHVIALEKNSFRFLTEYRLEYTQ